MNKGSSLECSINLCLCCDCFVIIIPHNCSFNETRGGDGRNSLSIKVTETSKISTAGNKIYSLMFRWRNEIWNICICIWNHNSWIHQYLDLSKYISFAFTGFSGLRYFSYKSLSLPSLITRMKILHFTSILVVPCKIHFLKYSVETSFPTNWFFNLDEGYY